MAKWMAGAGIGSTHAHNAPPSICGAPRLRACQPGWPPTAAGRCGARAQPPAARWTGPAPAPAGTRGWRAPARIGPPTNLMPRSSMGEVGGWATSCSAATACSATAGAACRPAQRKEQRGGTCTGNTSGAAAPASAQQRRRGATIGRRAPRRPRGMQPPPCAPACRRAGRCWWARNHARGCRCGKGMCAEPTNRCMVAMPASPPGGRLSAAQT